MTRPHHVKSARKNYPKHGIKKGDSYWWWKFNFGPKHYSLKPPRPSQLTRSEFTSSLLAAQEAIEDLKPDGYESVEDFMSDVENTKSDLESLKDDTESKRANMPEPLQQGDTGQQLESRVSELETLIGEFDGIDTSEPEVDGKSDEEARQVVTSRIEEIKEEIAGFNWSID